MSTPTENSVPVTFNLNSIGLGDVAGLIGGTKWGDGYGAGVALTYSFPSGEYAWSDNDYSFEDEFSGWSSLSGKERDGVRAALNTWSSVANLTFIEVADNKTEVGDLRFALTDVIGADFNGWAYLPESSPRGGDVWLSESWHPQSGKPVKPGTYGYLTLIHEIGHALGLKHPFEEGATLPKKYDNHSYTVMSYSVQAGDDEGWANFYPTTPMWFDILAIQQLYGVRPHNEGDSVYSYSGSKHYWETIDDTGGNDTIKVGGSVDAVINLNGQWSKIGKPIKFNHGKQTETVAIGPNTVIENAAGGSGDDRLTGNALGNVLNGGKGNDALTGLAGGDYLLGGKGKDKFVFASGFGTDTIADFSTKKGDVIALDDALFGNFAAVTQALSLNGSSQVVITAGADSITLASVHDMSLLKANDFDFV